MQTEITPFLFDYKADYKIDVLQRWQGDVFVSFKTCVIVSLNSVICTMKRMANGPRDISRFKEQHILYRSSSIETDPNQTFTM